MKTPVAYEDLPETARSALSVASLLGRQFELPEVYAVGFDASAFDAAFDSAILVEESAMRARFRNDALWESARASLPRSEKRAWSAALAKELLSRGGSKAKAGELFLIAQQFEAARTCLVQAGEEKCLANEYGEALEHLQAAFEVWPINEDRSDRKKVLQEMARCAANSGMRDAQRFAWEQLLGMLDPEEEAVLAADCQRRLGEIANEEGRLLEAKQRFRVSAEIASASGDAAAEANHWMQYGGFLSDNLKQREAIQALDTAIAAAERCGTPGLQAEAMALLAMNQAMIGRGKRGLELIEQATQIAIEADLPATVAKVYRRKANVLEYSGDYRGYRDLELEALEMCRTNGEIDSEMACLACVSYAFFRLGQWKQSLEAIRVALEELGVQGELRVGAIGIQACIAAFRGERRSAAAGFKEALEMIGIHGGLVFEFYIHWAKGTFAMLEGKNEEADQEFSELIALWGETDDRKDAVAGLVFATSFYAEKGDMDSLAKCKDILNTIVSDNQSPENASAVQASMAELAWAKGDVETASASISKAREGYRRQGLLIEQAWVGGRLGLMLASKGAFDQAEVEWRSAAELCRKMGMRPMLERIDRDRVASGASASAGGAATRASLTKRQLEVLRLIAEGLTNKEAAARLNLSPRTVEMHVASSLERLNCRARTDAIKRAAQLGLL